MAEMKHRLVRVVDFLAEGLEAEADRAPRGMKGYADSLRRMANTLRQSDNPKTVRILEEQHGEEGADFVRPDPASQ